MPIQLTCCETKKRTFFMNRQETKARMSAANLNSRLDLDALDGAIAKAGVRRASSNESTSAQVRVEARGGN
jgi:hypothetical protein